MTDRLDELLAVAAVEHLGEDAGLGSITAWVELHKAAPALLAALQNAEQWLGKLIADGGHENSVAPQHAVRTLDQVNAAISKACNE